MKNISFISISNRQKHNIIKKIQESSYLIINPRNIQRAKLITMVIGITQQNIPNRNNKSYTLFLKFKPTCFFKIFDKINDIKNSHKNVDKKYIRDITVFLQTIAAPIIAAIPGIGISFITQCKMHIKLYIQRPNTQYPVIDKILQVKNLFK